MQTDEMKSRGRLDDRIRILRLWMSGVKIKDIALEVGVSLSTVYRWIRRWHKEGTLAYTNCWNNYLLEIAAQGLNDSNVIVTMSQSCSNSSIYPSHVGYNMQPIYHFIPNSYYYSSDN